jgi:hypothetical protein
MDQAFENHQKPSSARWITFLSARRLWDVTNLGEVWLPSYYFQKAELNLNKIQDT